MNQRRLFWKVSGLWLAAPLLAGMLTVYPTVIALALFFGVSPQGFLQTWTESLPRILALVIGMVIVFAWLVPMFVHKEAKEADDYVDMLKASGEKAKALLLYGNIFGWAILGIRFFTALIALSRYFWGVLRIYLTVDDRAPKRDTQRTVSD